MTAKLQHTPHQELGSYLERLQGCLNHAGQENAELVILCAGQIVIAGILYESAEEEGPGEVVNGILL